MPPTRLTLPEEILLLMLNDDTGRNMASLPAYLAAGAGLAELTFSGHLTTAGEGRKARFAFVPGTEDPSDPFLSRIMARLKEKGIDTSPQNLVSRIAQTKAIMDLLISRLVDRGILRREKKKVLFVFTHTTYPTADPAPEAELKSRLRTTLFTSGPVSPEDAVLITLANAGGILRRNFDKQELKERKARIKEITSGANLAAGATRQAIEAVQAAVMVSTTMPAMTSVTT